MATITGLINNRYLPVFQSCLFALLILSCKREPALPTITVTTNHNTVSLTAAQGNRLHNELGLSEKDFARSSPDARRRIMWQLQNPDRERERIAFLALEETGTREGKGERDALVKALRQLRSLRTYMATHRPASKRFLAGVPVYHLQPISLSPTAGLPAKHSDWVPIGPENMGGRTRSILIDPDNPEKSLWAGSVAGGVWHSEDGGKTFLPVDDLMSNLAISAMAMVPNNHTIIYAGTGEGFGNIDAVTGGGIFRTVGGSPWERLNGTDDKKFESVNRIAISRDGKTLLVATTKGILRGKLDSDSAKEVHWATEPTLSASTGFVLFDPKNDNNAIAGELEGGHAYFSTDAGQHWTKAAAAEPWTGRVELAYATANSSIVYASVSVSTTDKDRNGEIWRSKDGGKTYSRRKSLSDGVAANFLGRQGWYANTIWAGDPDNSDLVLVGGVDLWKSRDGGDTLSRLSLWSETGSVHADQHTIASHPSFGKANRTVFFGNDGGLYKAVNLESVGSDEHYTSGWTSLNDGYVVTEFYSGCVNTRTGTIIGGTQDNGTVRLVNNNERKKTWTTTMGGDGGWTVSDDDGSRSIFYSEYVYLSIFRSFDDGASAEFINGQYWSDVDGKFLWKRPPYQIPDSYSSFTNEKDPAALFIAPFILDPNNSNRILAGGRSLWRTDDARTPNDDQTRTGPSWFSIKPPIPGEAISALAIQSGNANNVWVGYERGSLFTSDNATAAHPRWKQLSGPGISGPLPAGTLMTSIAIDPTDSTIVYITYSSFKNSNVWKTENNGKSWRNIGANLPAAPARAVAIHPKDNKSIYLGTDVGLFASADSGEHWGPSQEGPNSAPIYKLFWIGEDLVVVTHGRGMFRLPVPAARLGP
jgi:photosystem II stability/assembly factor-like uncharacterized protein